MSQVMKKRSGKLRNGSTVRINVGSSVEEKGSRFLGIVLYPVKDRKEAEEALALLRKSPEFAGATHRISAYRCGDKADFCDDDGEDRAGSALRGVLKKEKALGVVAVVARWYGGVNIGKARFEHIRERCRVLLKEIKYTPGKPISLWSETGEGYRLDGEKNSQNEYENSGKKGKRKLEERKSDSFSSPGSAEQRRKLFAAAATRRLLSNKQPPECASVPALSSSSSASVVDVYRSETEEKKEGKEKEKTDSTNSVIDLT